MILRPPLILIVLCANAAAQLTPAKPEDVGFSARKLEAVRAWLSANDTTSLVVAVDGKNIFEYGDQHKLTYLASARKTLLAVLYGHYVDNGTIDLKKTLRDLGINDVGGLHEQELSATVADVIGARSGVYHAASNSGDDTASAPPRNSQKPGTYFLYNNWDFNAAGAIFEKATGKNIYDAFAAELAAPLGMEDFHRDLQKKTGDPSKSIHLAYHFTLSVADMARLGQLMLQRGKWEGKQLEPADWIDRMTSLSTPVRDMNPPYRRALGTGQRWGYGYMVWVWDAPRADGPFGGAYTAWGVGGQYITVIPSLRMVVAEKVDTSEDSPHHTGKRWVDEATYMATLQMLVNAKK